MTRLLAAIRSHKFVVILGCLACLLRLSSVTVAARFSDGDGDGIDDDLEQSLAESAFPLVHRQYDDDCPGPVPHPVLFRARYPSVGGVVDDAFIVINYVVLYDEDCGWAGDLGAHFGDNEAFQVWLVTDGSTWYFDYLTAHQHWDKLFCEGEDLSLSQEMWIGGDKHSNYAQSADCGCFDTDTCSETVDEDVTNYDLYNIGEPDSPLLTDLGQIDSDWSGYGIWDYSYFEGAGVITWQLGTGGFIDIFQTPEAIACVEACQSAEDDCEADECQRNGDGCYLYDDEPDACTEDYDECVTFCNISWD